MMGRGTWGRPPTGWPVTFPSRWSSVEKEWYRFGGLDRRVFCCDVRPPRGRGSDFTVAARNTNRETLQKPMSHVGLRLFHRAFSMRRRGRCVFAWGLGRLTGNVSCNGEGQHDVCPAE